MVGGQPRRCIVYEILMRRAQHLHRPLTVSGTSKLAVEEAEMLDLIFVVSGFAIILLMAGYAASLLRL